MQGFDSFDLRKDPKSLYIRENILEPNRLLSFLSPLSSKKEIKNCKSEKKFVNPFSTFSSPPSYKTHKCAEGINKIYKGMLRSRLKKKDEKVAAPLASVCVSKRPWGEHMGYSNFIVIERKTGAPIIFTADKIKSIKRKHK